MDTNVGLRSKRQKRSRFSVLSQLLLSLVPHKVLPSSNQCGCGAWGHGLVVALSVLEGLSGLKGLFQSQ